MIIVDGPNFAWRGHYAAPDMMTTDLAWTGAISATMNMLAKLLEVHEPQRVIVAWDGPWSWRREVYPAYKATRRGAYLTKADELRREQVMRQIGVIQELLHMLRIAQVQHDTLEADDWAGILTAKVVRARGSHDSSETVALLSSDRDWFQLLRYRGVTQYTDHDQAWTAERVYREHGVRPRDWPAYLALKGDRTDNIQQVRKGIGPKTAAKMLSTMDGACSPTVFAGLTPEENKLFRANLKVTKVLDSLPGIKMSACLDRGREGSFPRRDFWDILVDNELPGIWALKRKLLRLGRWPK